MEWRKIPDWPYEVSEYGDVRRVGGGQGTKSKKLMNGFKLTKFGYRGYDLYKNGERWKTSAHHLVAILWLGPKPSEKHEVAHNDTDGSNSHYSNLRWATRKENIQDTVEAGKFKTPGFRGSDVGTSKLSEDDVREIRRLSSEKIGQRTIAKKFGVSRSTVCEIQNGKIWSWLV